jgi:2-dehydro-3-deoxygluconokinase
MHAMTPIAQREARPKSFDVICAGEARWQLAGSEAPFSKKSARVHLRPGRGVVSVALLLARAGLRVGLATVLLDDELGRAAMKKIAASSVDVAGIALARPNAGFVLVDASGGANQAPSRVEKEEPVEVPVGWSSQVLLLSGLSPVVSHAAALCKAARTGRRTGAVVFIDFNASLHAWSGRDPRTIRMVLREVDVARCSFEDLAVLGMDVATVRSALPRSAVLVVSNGAGGSVATGPFGEVAFKPRELTAHPPSGVGDPFTAAICAEWVLPGAPRGSESARWLRALQRGHAAAMATRGR